MANDEHTVPKCSVCDQLMFPYEETFLCMAALAESIQSADGRWGRIEESAHPMRSEEEVYLKAHGQPPAEFI
jgi:hypothetical protein